MSSAPVRFGENSLHVPVRPSRRPTRAVTSARRQLLRAQTEIEELKAHVECLEHSEGRLKRRLAEEKELVKDARVEAEESLAQVARVEEKIDEMGASMDALRRDFNQYRGWWLTENRSLKAVLREVPKHLPEPHKPLIKRTNQQVDLRADGDVPACPDDLDVLSEDLPDTVIMEGVIVNGSTIQQHEESSRIHDRALDQVFKANVSLRHRILTLEHRKGCLKSQIRLQKRALTNVTDKAAKAERLVVIAEERFQEFEHKIEKLTDEHYRYCRWWLSEHQLLKDLLEFVANPSHPSVRRIMSSSRERFLTFDTDSAW
ncbi:hypothetical protein FA13DRAFT_1787260 [Coprinellus micaceus]|uniref:Uncharacterized protein n=1 Tax=Coprinellus micaceus TaxID=71717 RepID=A0A4Y7TSR8_COPMI|nr:hypothetical protein FA13DRAFT_1787260 [Coprinellus micaceus]